MGAESPKKIGIAIISFDAKAREGVGKATKSFSLGGFRGRNRRSTMTTERHLPENQMGPAEKLLDLVLNSSAHLWHNRPGLELGGVWYARREARKQRHLASGAPVKP